MYQAVVFNSLQKDQVIYFDGITSLIDWMTLSLRGEAFPFLQDSRTPLS